MDYSSWYVFHSCTFKVPYNKEKRNETLVDVSVIPSNRELDKDMSLKI